MDSLDKKIKQANDAMEKLKNGIDELVTRNQKEREELDRMKEALK